MKKQTITIPAKFIVGTVLFFLFSYLADFDWQVAVLLLLLYLYLARLGIKGIPFKHILFLYLLGFVLMKAMINYGLTTIIPFTFLPLLVTLLFGNLKLSLLMSLALSLVFLRDGYVNFFILSFMGGILSALLVLNARHRYQIIRAGIITGVVLFGLRLGHYQGWLLNLFDACLIFATQVVSAIVVIGILPVFEALLGVVTNISLLELADFNHPLLQRLMTEAAGTYHHSLIVGNLADAACKEVRANSLLARIGAYYHDIGKLGKAQYFSENQQGNNHEQLLPAMSKLVIINHVKEGEELAARYRLNPMLIDFIRTHHGTSLVHYFYYRALEDSGATPVEKDDFRYPGPKPHSKETAIVMLADSVEAATRALKNHSPSDIAETVHKVINNKFIDGQLDECDLTLRDLEKISGVFIHILQAIYHSRVVYPSGETREDNRKKPTEDS